MTPEDEMPAQYVSHPALVDPTALVDPAALGDAAALVDPAALGDAAEQASEFLKSLANPVRLRILCMLADGEATVGEITDRLAARQSLVSQHLALLRKDGLVRPTREGQSIRYALADSRVERLIGVLYETFCPRA